MKAKIIRTFNKFKNLSFNWEKIKNSGDVLFQAGWRFFVLLLFLGVALFLIKGLRNDAYAIKTFQVPDAFSKAGYSDGVIAKKLVDELNAIETFVSSAKAGPLDNVQSEIGKPDLNIEVMGVGLTLNTITYYLRDLLGRKNRSIGGELTDVDQKLSLTLRMTDHPPQTFSRNYQENERSQALSYVLHEAAKKILQNLDPYRIAVYYYRKKESSKCLEAIGEILETRPEEAKWAYLAWGNLLNQEDKPREAMEKFRQAIQLDSQFELAWTNLAWAEFELKNHEKAIAAFQKLTTLNPQKGSYWNSLAFCHRRSGQYEKADQAYAKAVKTEPDVIWWPRNWADFKLQQKDTAAFEALFSKIKNNPNLRGLDYYRVMASYAMYTGRPDSAAHYIQNALALDPDNMGILQQLTNLHYRHTKNFEQVKVYARRLIDLAEEQSEIRPRHFRQNYYNYMARADYSLEEFDSALIHVQKAIDLDTLSSAPYTTLAETYAFMGEYEAFYQSIEIALDKGFKNLDQHLHEEPYRRFAKEERFLKLLDKYYSP